MKKKYINFLIIFTLIFALLFSFHTTKFIKADSGFDTSYESDSSLGSSDWESSSSSSSSYSSEKLFVMILFLVLSNIVNCIRQYKYSKYKVPLSFYSFNYMTEEEIKKILPNYNARIFVNDRFNDFIEIQNAWMNFDYDKLRTLLTDELYNQYEMQLKTLELKHEKNIMLNYKLLSFKIINIKNENGIITLETESMISFIDYIVNNANTVVRGSKHKFITQHYKMTFVCNLNNSDIICPNCGVPLNNPASNKCDNCGTVVSTLSNKWVLAKKESLDQK